jgi:ubiquitin-protein ligase
MNPHIRRLYADHRNIIKVFDNHPYIRLVEIKGDPPERYIIEFHVNVLVEDKEANITIVNTHKVEVYLPVEYPRRPPFCRMLTPVFHPNIDPQKICIGDHWSAGQSLDQLIIRIGEMICFQSFNTKSPLNAKAAVWVEENIARLPLDKADFLGSVCQTNGQII